jgi:hypothetical protein
MNITRFNITNQSPEEISFPNNRNLYLRIRLEWADQNTNTINFTVTYSVEENDSNIKFQNSKVSNIIKHDASINSLIIEDTLSFIKSGTNSNPSDQFTLKAIVNINGIKETDLITVNII